MLDEFYGGCSNIIQRRLCTIVIDPRHHAETVRPFGDVDLASHPRIVSGHIAGHPARESVAHNASAQSADHAAETLA